MAAKKKLKPTVVEFHFDDAEVADVFLSWLCNSGEQHYWEMKEYGHGPVASFDYHKLNRGKFGPKVAAPTSEED